MFTKEEALKFISQKLEVPDLEQRLQSDRRNLLNEIATNIQTHVLFQNLRLLQDVPEKRHRPSLDEIKVDILSGYGGLCYNLNLAAHFLLKAVGFNASIAIATVTTSQEFSDNHAIVYVSDVEKPGDKFLVEVGVGFPTFRAVSLDFEDESPEFVDSFIEYKYIKHDGKIQRIHKERDPPKNENSVEKPEFVPDGWTRLYYANPEGCSNLEELHPHFDKVFTDPLASPFHLSFRVLSFPGKKAVMVVDSKTLIENEKGELIPTSIEGGDDGILQTVRQYFPILPEDFIRKALISWRQTQ